MKVILSPRLDLNWDSLALQHSAPFNASVCENGSFNAIYI
jgi:hypothetical protein